MKAKATKSDADEEGRRNVLFMWSFYWNCQAGRGGGGCVDEWVVDGNMGWMGEDGMGWDVMGSGYEIYFIFYYFYFGLGTGCWHC